MHHRTLFVLLFAAAMGCGGSSSETPFPAEPEGQTLGPAGETSPTGSDDLAPDAGPSVEP